MSEIWAALRDPRVSTLLALSIGPLVGLAVVLLAYRGLASLLLVPLQVPFLVSGGFGGLALLGTSLGLLNAHVDRVDAAEERAQIAEVQRDVLLLLRAVGPR